MMWGVGTGRHGSPARRGWGGADFW
uniref:Uncharacterized protein n=1 Tax=Arundo donax TaxID=35708 RepID=A0A0A9C5Z2_ARUDO